MRQLSPTLAVLLAAAAALAQEPQAPPLDHVALRITTVRADGRVQVDRGTRDRVMVGDPIVLFPPDGRTRVGGVVEVDERTALVELAGTGAALPPGTKGEVLVPRNRQRPAQPQPDAQPQPEGQGQAQQPPPDDMWRPGMALLAGVKPVQPEERATTIAGRAYFIGDLTHSLGNNDNSYLRLGTDFAVDNPGGADGGTFRFHGEFVQSMEVNYHAGPDLRFYDVSYAQGGTRFNPWRFQVGRFLQNGMPELGILDGVEVSYRTEGGDRFGGTFGWLPLLDDDMVSGEDMAVSAYYIWTPDLSERLLWGFALEKTWHEGKQDRDLAVVKTRCTPPDGCEYGGAVWVDFYNHAQDKLKTETAGLTRANAYVSRHWKEQGGVLLDYTHEEYPELLRKELWQTLLQKQIADSHHDVVSLQGWLDRKDGGRLHARIAGWADEQKTGGSGELGLEAHEVLMPQSHADLTGFVTQGLDNLAAGGRVSFGRATGTTSWDAFYELATVHYAGFPSDRSDILQHRFAVHWTDDLGSGWDLALDGGFAVWEGNDTFTVAVYLQKFF
jgi:hypothetical protein